MQEASLYLFIEDFPLGKGGKKSNHKGHGCTKKKSCPWIRIKHTSFYHPLEYRIVEQVYGIRAVCQAGKNIQETKRKSSIEANIGQQDILFYIRNIKGKLIVVIYHQKEKTSEKQEGRPQGKEGLDDVIIIVTEHSQYECPDVARSLQR